MKEKMLFKINNEKAPIFRSGLFEFGAGNETRTRDPNLGKVVLYQLSYSRVPAIIPDVKNWSTTLCRILYQLHKIKSVAYPYGSLFHPGGMQNSLCWPKSDFVVVTRTDSAASVCADHGITR